MFGGAIGGFMLALVTMFKKNWSPLTAPIYALLEGFFLGGISAYFEKSYPGIATQAMMLTFGVMIRAAAGVQNGIIEGDARIQVGSDGGNRRELHWCTQRNDSDEPLFSHSMSFLYSSTPLGIGISVVVVIIAALNLILDFDMIETGVRMGAPKYMEWYGAFAMMVTLIWLYLEILRLLAKTRRR